MQRISTPFVDQDPERANVREADGASYRHMKFCKWEGFEEALAAFLLVEE